MGVLIYNRRKLINGGVQAGSTGQIEQKLRIFVFLVRESKLQAALNAAKTLDWRRETVHGRAAWPRQAFFSIGPISYCGRS